ncbi:retrovirus-related Pol polyprotein from transposon 297 [Trichonephila clavipes]|nr:retrovirus-related Pol polyprotein from transposon 297 [Trichonephila clavipes]
MFVTKNGTYAFCRMPFGLSGAAPNFQKAINIIHKPVIGKFVNVYMDDVIILSPSLTQHIEYLKEVFRLVQDAGLTLNKNKCTFGCDDLKYLGLIINKEGIKTDETNVTAIVEMKPPRNSKEVSKFLGVGAVLNQEQRPVVFDSRALSNAERNYTVTQRESLVVVWALNKFKTYLGSLPIKVITDHAALTRLTNGKNLSSRMIRWVLKLAEFNIEWKHRIGTQNAVADVLSRNPFESIIGEKVNSAIIRGICDKLGIRHVKTVVYRPQANKTERVLVQMIANYVNDQHDTWDQFLREFAYAIRTAVNEMTGKTHAELFLGRKLITPFQKLVMVSEGTEFAVGDIERLFDEARRNSKFKHEKWKKYYNRRRRDVQIKVNDWILIATHPVNSATKKVVAKFKPKFEGPYRALEVKNNNNVVM